MVQIGKDFYEDLTVEKLALIDSFAAGEVPAPGPQNGRFSSEALGGPTALAGLKGGEAHNGSVARALRLEDTVKRIDVIRGSDALACRGKRGLIDRIGNERDDTGTVTRRIGMERAECSRNNWIVAAIAGVVVLLFVLGIGDLHWLAGLFLGAVTFSCWGHADLADLPRDAGALCR